MALRYARLYDDGSYNVSGEAEDFQRAKQLLSDSRDDDDVELVQVEIQVVKSFGRPKLQVIPQSSDLLDTLKGADHTLSVHGHIDADTPLHERIRAAIAAATGAAP